MFVSYAYLEIQIPPQSILYIHEFVDKAVSLLKIPT